jgi:hypothetical protein
LLDDVLSSLDNWPPVLRTSVPEARRVLGVLIERVVPRRTTKGSYSAEISWTSTSETIQKVLQHVTSFTPAA